MDLALNKLQRLICRKTQPTNLFMAPSLYLFLIIYFLLYWTLEKLVIQMKSF